MRGTARLALLWLALAACATGPGPLALEFHLRWPIASEPDAAPRPRLGVAALRDARPEAQRAGVRPGLALGWMGLEREGVLRTGDADFGGALAPALHADLVATLARGGSFAAVLATPLDPRASPDWASHTDLDYVLVPELDDATASQWRSFRVTPFRVGFVRDRWGPPQAHVSVRYELYGRSGRIWQGRVATRHRPDEGDLVFALAEALALQHEELADRLDAVVRARAPRRVAVRVLDGCELGDEGVQRLLDAASASFAREADLVFAGQAERWSPPRAATNLDALLDAARATPPPGGGIVLALASEAQVRERALASARAGLSVPLGAHALALCSDPGVVSRPTVAHELAHLFGAVHVREPTSIMSATVEFPARFFDPLNRRVLRALRERDFARPLDAAQRAQLAALYRGAASDADAPELDPAELELALRALATVAR